MSSKVRPSPSDPLARAQRRTKRVAAFAITAVTIAGVWAFWPARNASGSQDLGAPPKPTTELSSAAVLATTEPINLAAFDAALWIDPPAPIVDAAPTPPPAPAPLRAQLIAIAGSVSSATPSTGADSGRTLSAIFYDPDADVLRTLRTGDRIDGRTIDAIDAHGVTISLADAAQRLELRPGESRRAKEHAALSTADALAQLMVTRLPSTPKASTPASPARPSATAPRGKGRRP